MRDSRRWTSRCCVARPSKTIAWCQLSKRSIFEEWCILTVIQFNGLVGCCTSFILLSVKVIMLPFYLVYSFKIHTWVVSKPSQKWILCTRASEFCFNVVYSCVWVGCKGIPYHSPSYLQDNITVTLIELTMLVFRDSNKLKVLYTPNPHTPLKRNNEWIPCQLYICIYTYGSLPIGEPS